MPSKKPVVAIDVDEVLAYFIPTIADYYNERALATNAEVPRKAYNSASFFTMDFHLVWGVSEDECHSIVEDFFKSDHFLRKIRPVEGALHPLQRLKEKYELHIVTARQNKIEAITR